MRCPLCGHLESKVVDSRPSEDGSSIRRRRECLACAKRFTTYERVSDSSLLVTKSDGSSEAYDRAKVMRGLLIACAKRPITPEQIDELVDDMETELRSSHKGEVTSKEIGEMVTERLAHLDEVAYVRFASVYKHFNSVEEFASVLEGLN